MENQTQRRAAGNIVKFLALMLVFTLIVRGTSGVTMARVSVATPGRSMIVDTVTGTATVSATDIIEITAPEGLIITEMLVGVGQSIQIGNAIATFPMAELEDMYIREVAALDMMRLELENLRQNENMDASAIANAERALDRAREDYNTTVRQGQDDIATARVALDALLLQNGSTFARNLQRAFDDYQSTTEQGRANVEAAERELFELISTPTNETDNTALQNAIRSHQRALDDYNSAKEQGEADIAEAQANLNEIRSSTPAGRAAVDTAERNYHRAREDYNATRQRNRNNTDAAQTTLNNAYLMLQLAMATDPSDQPSITAALNGVEQARTALDAAQRAAEDSIRTASRAVEDAATNLAQARQNFNDGQETELETAENTLESARERAANSLLSASRALEDAEITLAREQQNFYDGRQRDIEQAEEALEAVQTLAANNQLAAARALEDATYSADTQTVQANTALQNAISQANSTRQAAARQVEDARVGLSSVRQTHQKTTAQNNITTVTLQLDIENKQTTVDILRKLIENNGVLYANTTGVVAATQPTSSVVAGAPIVTLRDVSGGFEAQIQIPVSQAENLAVGNESEVTTGGGSIFFNPTVTGVVSSISQPDENDNVTVTVALPAGNWTAGQRVDIQVVLHSGSYDSSLPISAIRSDNGGYFVYVIAQTSTVLGLQNEVVRVSVNIVAQDNDMVSVSGAVWPGSEVIVGSNKAVTAGDRVRVE